MNRTLVGALLVVLAGVACKEREPYPWRAPKPGQDVRAPEPPAAPLPLAVVVTPEGSFLVTARADGSDLDVRRVSGLAHVRRDGTLARFDLEVRSQKKGAGDTPESVFTTVTWRVDDEKKTLFPLPNRGRPDLKELAARDPDLAPLYYHRETIRPLGVLGSSFAWIVKTDGFLGGAHPYNDTRLLVVDAETGEPADTLAPFGSRDLRAEALQGVDPDDCVRRWAGVAGVEGIGGEPIFVAMLAHEYEFCRGRFRLVRLAPPDLRGPVPSPASLRLHGGVLQSESGDLRVPGVADFRASTDGRVVVMLMSLGSGDRPPSPLVETPDKAQSREVRVWVKGGPSPVVLGRGTRILAVQFLVDHPARSAILEAFTRP